MSDTLDSYQELVAFAKVLTEAGHLRTATDVIYFFEKPWKWRHEYDAYTAAGSPESLSPRWEQLWDRLDGTDETCLCDTVGSGCPTCQHLYVIR